MTTSATRELRTSEPVNEQDAYEWCRRYARERDENFTVVSWLLPRDLRPHLFALYAYCRWTDDLGDEAPGDRLAQLDEWERELRACYERRRERPLFAALGATVDAFDIPIEPFVRLIEANRMDQRITSFATYEDLLHYCEHSATPVGRMVLYVLGYRDEERHSLADRTCIALQLANFWQDVSLDLEKGRLYLPLADLERFAVSLQDVRERRCSRAFRDLMAFEVDRARRLFSEGRALEDLVSRRARLDMRLFRLGGEAVLDAIERAGFDTLTRRPTVSRARKAWMAVSQGVRLKLGI